MHKSNTLSTEQRHPSNMYAIGLKKKFHPLCQNRPFFLQQADYHCYIFGYSSLDEVQPFTRSKNSHCSVNENMNFWSEVLTKKRGAAEFLMTLQPWDYELLKVNQLLCVIRRKNIAVITSFSYTFWMTEAQTVYLKVKSNSSYLSRVAQFSWQLVYNEP